MATSKDRTAKAWTDTYASVWDALADTPEQAAHLRALGADATDRRAGQGQWLE